MLKMIERYSPVDSRYSFAILAVALAGIIRAILDPVLGAGVPFILFYPAVVMAAWFGGLWPGLLSAMLGGFVSSYFFLPPRPLIVSEPNALAQLIVFLLGSTLICLLAESLHRATRRAEEGEARERAERDRFHVTLSSIGDAVIATDAQGRITFMNRVAESLTGWTSKECSGRRLEEVFKIVNEETRQTVENPALQALQKRVIVGLANHTVLIAKDGREHPIDDSAAPIYTDAGLTGAVLVFRDITRRRAAEREIRASREQLRVTLSSIGDAVLATDAKGRVSYLNPIAEELLGYSLSDVSGRPLAEIFNIVDEFTRQTTENPVERVLRDGQIVGLANHTLLLRPDGTEIPIDDSAAPIRDGAGDTIGVVLVFRDITERRRGQKAQALLAAIVESADESIISTDLYGRITSWNAGAERLFGYREDEMIGQPIFELIPPGHAEEEATILQRIRRGETVERYETVRVRKDGTHVDISLAVSPVKGPDGVILGSSKIARDITEAKRLDQQLLDADRQKDNFLALVAHELRNPLGPIRNAVKILQIQRPADRDLLAYCGLIDNEVSQITRLLDDLLDISRITRGKLAFKKEPIDLIRVVNSALETSRPMIAEKGHKLTARLPQETLMVYADPLRLEQVFSNLLNNSAKFTDPGGHIGVDIGHADDRAFVRVKDSGTGISAELLPKVFDMFVQGGSITERKYEGLGLGLTLARDIVEFHGGTIEARSDGCGQGSEFVVFLPLSDPSQIDTSCAVTTTGLLRGGGSGARIVVIEDNRNQALSLERLLTAMGHEVRVAHDGSSGMKLLAQFVPDFALIDIGLPRMNGYELARWMREQPQLQDVVLIAQTGWGREEDRKQAREAGFEHHLVKPIDHERLRQILNEAPKKASLFK